MSKQLSNERKGEIFAFYKAGVAQKELALKYGISQSAISRLIKKREETGTVGRISGSGRRSSFSSEDIKFLKEEVKKNPKIGSEKLKTEIERVRGKGASSRTIRRSLCAVNLPARVAISKPLLSGKNKISRYDHSLEWLSMKETDWENVLFSDETKINLFHSDGRMYVRRGSDSGLEERYLKPTVKHGGGSLMIWGCFSSKGVGRFEFIDGTMDARKYIGILNRSMDSSAADLGLSDYIFQQDNDPKHRSKLAREYFTAKKTKLMSWPSQSPDMNPIEHLWIHLKAKIRARSPRNMKELKQVTKEEWERIDPAFCKKLVLSMKERVCAMFLAKGGHTRY